MAATVAENRRNTGRQVKPWRRVHGAVRMPAHHALAVLIAYVIEGRALKRDVIATRQRARGKRHAAPC